MRKIVSFGGGVNGVAMLIAMVRSGDRPDAILFADTGGEREESYQYIEYFSKWLQSKGFPPVTFVTYKTKHGKRVTLEQECLKAKSLPSIAYGFKTCSQKHKIFPQEKWIKSQFGKESITWYIGFDFNESRRIKENPTKHYTNKYPLIELEWTREQCIEEIRKEGLKIPHKTSCFFCPNMKKPEILALDNEYKERAIAMEKNASLTKIKGLGRRFAWSDLIEGNETDANKEQKNQEDFKRLTGEDLEPIVCECI